ncbi:MAG: PAS domain-containing sensor histidine kinase [bacterium]
MARVTQNPIDVVQSLHALIAGRYEPIDPDGVSADARPVVKALNLLQAHLEHPESNRPVQHGRDLGDEAAQERAAPEAEGPQTEESVRGAQERLRRVVENTPVGICITDRHGTFEDVNPQYCRLYQYEREELIGRHFTMVVPDEEQERMRRLHDEFIEGTAELRGEWRVVRKDGTELSILADAARITDIDGEPKKVTFVMDITERKRVEESLWEANSRLKDEIEERLRIERTQREVERIIRHDLRNPLNGVFTASELLSRTSLSEEQQDLLRIIRDSGYRLKSMIDSSLDLAKMEQGIFTLEPQPVEIQETLLAVQSQLLGLLGEHKVTATLRVNDEPLETTEPVVVHGEAQYLETLLANLVRNAIEASPRGGRVSVEVTDEGDHVLFDVHNAGAVPEPVRDRFFERNSSYGKPDGNGIGTYVAALIASAHSGSIWFTTDECEGTHVYVRIPKQPSVRAEEPGTVPE